MRVPWRQDPLAKTTDGAIDPELDSRIHRAFGLRVDSLARVRGDILAEFSAASSSQIAISASPVDPGRRRRDDARRRGRRRCLGSGPRDRLMRGVWTAES
jgi:hypothetical protein